MLRRSAPALLGLFVCLLAAHLSSAAPAFNLDESRIRLSLDSASARVHVEVENGTGREFDARLRVELLDPREGVRADAAADVRLRRGRNALAVALELPLKELLDAERKEFPWYRLRYSVEPAPAAGAPPALEGVVSVSEVTPGLFGLTVISAPAARPGSQYVARARTANPVTQRPVEGVAVEATLTFDGEGDEKTVLKASGATDDDGLVTLGFDLPGALRADDDAELEVRARRGILSEKAETQVAFEDLPGVLLTTDKPLYQPGQTVHMRALAFDQGGRALAGEEVTFRVEDEEDSTAFTATLKTSRFGVASADWRVPAGTKLGTYTLKLVMDEDRYDIDHGAVTDFKVGRYELPNFSVTAKADRPYYLGGQQPSVEVRADYLFGRPVRRGRVRVVRQTERRWNYREQKYETEEERAVEGELKDGLYLARIDLAGEHEELAGSGYQRYRDLDFVAYVTDPTTNRTEQRRFQVRLTKEPIHLYVIQGRYRQAEGLPLAFYLAASYADGTPAECDVTVYEEGGTKRSAGGDGRFHEVTEAERALVSVRTNRYGVAKVSGPVVRGVRPDGNIPLRFAARDGAGRVGRRGEHFWAGRGRVPEIRVETDKSVYAAGETVRVELSSNAERMSVVVDAVSGGRVLYSRRTRLAGGRALLFIPTGPDFAGPVSVTATSAAPARDDGSDSYSRGARTVVFPRD
ncbi:MAG TPA: MG2 domain-containing protein, partial [Pyrinomonadaceae bacterium]